MPHQGAFISRELFKQLGDFNIFLKIRMDFEWFARCKKAGVSYKYVPKTIFRPHSVMQKVGICRSNPKS